MQYKLSEMVLDDFGDEDSRIAMQVEGVLYYQGYCKFLSEDLHAYHAHRNT